MEPCVLLTPRSNGPGERIYWYTITIALLYYLFLLILFSLCLTRLHLPSNQDTTHNKFILLPRVPELA